MFDLRRREFMTLAQRRVGVGDHGARAAAANAGDRISQQPIA